MDPSRRPSSATECTGSKPKIWCSSAIKSKLSNLINRAKVVLAMQQCTHHNKIIQPKKSQCALISWGAHANHHLSLKPLSNLKLFVLMDRPSSWPSDPAARINTSTEANNRKIATSSLFQPWRQFLRTTHIEGLKICRFIDNHFQTSIPNHITTVWWRTRLACMMRSQAPRWILTRGPVLSTTVAWCTTCSNLTRKHWWWTT